MWLVENYLPNFHTLRAEWVRGADQQTYADFIRSNFSKALAAYRDAVWQEACEAQRKYCAMDAEAWANGRIYKYESLEELRNYVEQTPICKPKNP